MADNDTFSREEYLLLQQQVAHLKEALAEQQQLMDDQIRFFKLTRELFCIGDLNNYFLQVNQAWEMITGYTAEELVGKRLFDFTHPDDLESLRRAVQTSLRHEVPDVTITRFRCRDGSWKWFDWDAVYHFETNRIFATASDVTAQIEARESERRFQNMADHAPVMIWTAGLDGTCTYVNRTWTDFTGQTLEYEQNRGWAKDVHPDDYERCRTIFPEAFSQQLPYQQEYRLKRRDGEFRWLLETGTPRYAPDGEFVGYIGSCVDITDQKQAQERLYHAQKLESIGRLAGGVAHELNNILTAIIGYTELATQSLSPESEEYNYLGNVSISAERAAGLIRQLLAFGRKQMAQRHVCDLNQLLEEQHLLLRQLLHKDIEIVTRKQERVWPVHVDRGQIEQLLLDLVVNARDAIAGIGTITLEVRNRTLVESIPEHSSDIPYGDYVELSVTDTGVGMTQSVRERLFEPFFTTKAPGQGTGLGLAACYGIVSQNNGYIFAESEPGKGACFRILLPASAIAQVIRRDAKT